MKLSTIGIVCAIFGLLVPRMSGQGVPPNDSFASPTELTGLPVVVTGSNQGATMEAGERLPSWLHYLSASVWFAWTAPVSGVVSVDTVGSDFSARLSVWSGNKLDGLTQVGIDNYDSAVIEVTQGVQYRISVYDSGAARGGTLRLQIRNTGSITGTVFGADGSTPLKNAIVLLSRWSASNESWDDAVSSLTSTQGTYEMISLVEGYYKVGFKGSSYDATEYYPESPYIETAQSLYVEGGQTVAGINGVLNDGPPDGHVTGRVTGFNGATPVSASLVKIYAKNLPNNKWYAFAEQRTRDDGTYDIGKLGAGVYRVGFTDENNSYFTPAFYKGGFDVNRATDIVVGKNAIMKDIDGSLLNKINLRGLVVSNGTLGPAFNPTQANYGVDVADSVTSLTVTPTVADEAYAARVNGTFIAPGTASAPINLEKGSNRITVEVNQDGGPSLRTYTILVTRGTQRAAALKSLVLDSGSLTPAFDPAVTLYTVKVGNSVESLTISPTAKSKGAKITVNGRAVVSGSKSGKIRLNPEFNTIDVAVIAGPGNASMNYRIVIDRARSSDANLSELGINGKGLTLQPRKFSPGNLNYRVQVPASTDGISIFPKSSSKSALVTIDGLKAGKKGKTVGLRRGKNVIRVLVTAQDGSRKLYRITANRGK